MQDSRSRRFGAGQRAIPKDFMPTDEAFKSKSTNPHAESSLESSPKRRKVSIPIDSTQDDGRVTLPKVTVLLHQYNPNQQGSQATSSLPKTTVKISHCGI